jgi:cholesterol 25-hydroxylase
MRRASRRKLEALTYIIPLLILDLTMIKKFADVPLPAMLLSGNYDPSILISTASLPNSTTAFKAYGSHRHTTFLVPTLHNFTSLSPLQTRRALPGISPTSRRLALELITSFLIYDTLFFIFHLSLHIFPPLRRFHTPHHSHPTQLHPQITNQLSIFERLGLVLLANFSLNIIGAHVLTRTLFVPVFVWLLVEIHSGMELPWGYEKLLPRGWGGGARKHARHHVLGKEGFEPFFGWWDGVWEKVGGREGV